MSEVLQVAKHDFTATREDEITLRVGDIVEEVEELPGDWWRGRVAGVRGTFPACFLQQVRSTGRCMVLFPFTPRQPDEVLLEVGQEVVMFGELDGGGWARGKVGDRLGWFPLTYVRQQPIQETITSPVLLRASVSKAFRHSIAGPVSGNLFDPEPEDEPLGPMFGSIASRLDDVSEESSKTSQGGFLSKLRHSFGGKQIQSEGGRKRLSSGSYLETQSVCSGASPALSRRNGTFSSFLRRFSLSSRAGSKNSLQGEEKDLTKPSRLSKSWDTTSKTGQKQQQFMKLNKSSEIVRIENDFGDMNVSLEVRARPCSSSTQGRSSQSVASSSLGRSYTRSSHLMRSDSGIGGSEGAATREEEEPFGQIEVVTDEVFSQMFSPSKKKEGGGVKLRTSPLGASAPLPEHRPCSRSGTATNPLTRWRGDQGQEVTQL